MPAGSWRRRGACASIAFRSRRRFLELPVAEGQPAQPLSGSGEDGIAEGWGRRRRGALADAARLLVVADLVDLDLRRLVHAQRAVVVEVALIDGAAGQRDLVVHR